jgi:hypothetical protein
MDLKLALIVDVLLLISSFWCILRVSGWNIFNPCIWWVALHAYTVTFRLVTLNLGLETLWVIGIRSNTELVNAAIASDLSLMAVVAAAIFAAHRNAVNIPTSQQGRGPTELDPRIGQIIIFLCLTIGTYALIKFGYAASAARARGIDVSSIDIGRLQQSSYPIAIAGFAVQGALILVALRGFTRWRVLLLFVLLALTSIQVARTAFVLGALFAFLIYQTRIHKTNLSFKWAIGFLLLGIAWFVYKPVRNAIDKRQDLSQIIASGQNYVHDTMNQGGSADTQLFDMQGTYMAAADEAGRRFYGSTILPLLYLPIPRFLWPDKPRINEYAVDISSPLRPLVQSGMTPLLSGESYVNFGWLGCAFIPFLYLLGMQIGWQRTRAHNITSAPRMIFLVLLVSMIQVFRDGLISLFIYPIVYYLPLFGWAIASELLAASSSLNAYFNPRFRAHSPKVHQSL